MLFFEQDLILFPSKLAHTWILNRLILDRPEALFSNEVPRGYQESTILGAVATKEDLEPKADQCKKVNSSC